MTTSNLQSASNSDESTIDYMSEFLRIAVDAALDRHDLDLNDDDSVDIFATKLAQTIKDYRDDDSYESYDE